VRRLVVILAIAVIAIAGVWSFNQAIEEARQKARERSGLGTGGRPENVEAIFGGADALKIVTGPERVIAERIAPPESEKPGERKLADYRATSKPITVPNDMSQQLGAALASPDSYRWKTTKGCIPRYGVRLSFSKGADRIDVYICFSCNILLVAQNGVTKGGEDFDDARPVFVRAAKKLFPDDMVIQQLPEQGCTGDD